MKAKTCACPNTNHATTPRQRRFCRDALTVARATRNRAAMARIRDALSPCPRRGVPARY